MALKEFSQQNGTRICFTEESTPGTTPASPSMRIVPVISSGLEVTKTLISSTALNSNRQKHFSRHGNRMTGGDILVEMAYETFDPLLRGALMSDADWQGSVGAQYMVPGSKKWYMTFEEGMYGQTTPNYKRFTGCLVNGLTLALSQDDIIRATFPIVGSDMTQSSSPLDATPGVGGNEALNNTPFVHKEATISLDGTPLAVVASYEMSIANGITPTFVIGSDVAVAHGYADLTVSGTATIFVENQVIYNYFINETEVELSLLMEDPDGNGYRIDMSKVKMNAASQPVGGEGPRQTQVTFEALSNDTDGGTVRITKLPANP